MQRPTYVFTVSPPSAVLNIGDTTAPFTGTLTVDGRPASFRLGLTLLDSNGTVALDTFGRLVVTGRGTARLTARAISSEASAAILIDTVQVRGVVPRIGLSTVRSVDTLKSLGDTLVLVAAALSTRGDTIRGAPIAWSTMSGGTIASLLDPVLGRVRAAANGSATFRASVDNATADRPVLVRQRPATLLPTGDSVMLRAQGETRQLAKVARDARGNVITGATVVFSGGSSAIATVASGGLVTAQGDGAALVRARTPVSGTDSLTATTLVTVARARLKVASGDAQSGSAGATLATPLVVQLIDSLGANVSRAGITVVFTATTSGTKVGGADSLLVQSDATGQAGASLTLSGAAGANRVSANGRGLAGTAVTFSATGTTGALSTMAAVSGNGQSGTVNANLAAPFVVVLKDGLGNGVAGQRVVFKVTAGGGKFAGADSLAVNSDTAGRASATLTLGRTAGVNSVAASSAAPSGSPVTFTATGNPGAASALAVTASPANGNAGASLTPNPQVAVRDAFGNTVTTSSATVTMAIVPGTGASGATLGGTTSVAAQAGVATFANLSIAQVGTGYRLVANASGLTSDTTTAFTIGSAAANKLAFTVQPSRVAAGIAIAPAIQVAVLDSLGNPAAGASNVITLSLGTTPLGGGGLFGTLQVAAANGVATFPDVHVGKVGAGYRLLAQAASLVASTSTAFDVAPGAPAQIVKISGDNQNQVPGATLGQSLVAQIRDAYQNVVPGDTVVFKVASGGGHFGTADSSVTATDSQGNASATYTLGPLPGTNTVQARSRRLPDSVVTFTESATQPGLFLKFTVQPTNTTGGVAIAPAIKVAVQDANGVTQPTATTNVTLSLQGGAAGATLSGTTAVAAVNGVATFSNVAVDKAGGAYQLVASASGVTGTTSTAFDVTTGPAARVRFATSPSAATAGADLGAVQVRIEDAGGNLVSASDAVSIAIASGAGTAGAHLRGTTSLAASGGMAQFTGLSIDSAGTGYALRASDGTLQATSTAFTVTAAPASRLTFSVQPGNVAAGAAITPAIQVAVRDSLGNLVTSSSPALTLAITPGTGTTGAGLTGGTATAQSGVAAFASVTINKSGTAYTLTAAGAGLSSAISSAFNVTSGAASRLVYVTDPSNATAGQAIAPAVRVAVQDALGNVVTNSSANVTTAIATGTGTAGATLSGTRTVSAVSGIATFGNLAINLAGSGYALRATSTGLTATTSTAFAVAPASAESLIVVSGNNQNGTAGGPLAAPFVVQVRDHFGNAVAGFAVTYKVTGGGGSFGGADSAVVATDTGGKAGATLTLGPTTTTNTAEARTPGLLGSPRVFTATVTPVATKLAFTVQPGNATAGVTIAPNVQVTVQTTDGVTVTSANSLVTIVLGGGTAGAHLRGTQSVNAVNGIATFSVSVDSAGSAYTLTASSPSLTSTTSAAFVIMPAPPVRLGFLVQPANTPWGSTISPPVQVAARDSLGNTAASGATITLALTPGTGTAGATLGGTTSVAAQNGAAAFGDLTIDKGGSGYTLTATSSGLTGATSAAFGITGGPVRLSFTSRPGTTTAGTALSPTPQVTVLDANGQPVTAATTSITVTLSGGTAGATLSGTKMVSAVNGVATFGGLSIDSAGAGYHLAAAGGGFTPDTAVFAIAPGAAVRAAFMTQPSTVAAGSVITPAVQVTLRDAIGNRSASTATVSVGIVLGTGALTATLSGTTSAAAVNGVATFSNLSIDKAASGYKLAAASSGLSPDTSTAFSVVTGTVANVTVSPNSATLTAVGATVQLSAEAHDGSGNVVPGQSFTWRSADTTVATVNSSGLVTAAKNGTAVVSATDNGTSGTSTITVAQAVASVAVSPPTASLAAIGQTQQFTATAKDANNNAVPGVTFTWTTSNAAVATVNDSGLATATGNGTAQITASASGKSGSASLSVAQTTTSVVVTPATAQIGAVGSTKQFAAQALDANGNSIPGKMFTWSSDATGVATVNASGLATAVANGTAHIAASVDGKSGSGTLTVTQVVASVAVSPPNVSFGAIGATQQLTATARDSNSNVVGGQTFTWGTSDATVATVSGSGLVTATGTGNATITATSGGKSGTSAVSVGQTTTSVVVSPASAQIGAVGSTKQFTAQALDANGNAIPGKTFAWSSDATGVATVNSSGLATAVANGTAHIAASVDGKSGSGTLTVAQVVASVAVSPPSVALTSVGATQQLTAVARDSNSNAIAGKTFTWSSDAPPVASVSASGLVTAQGAGSTTIRATTEGVTGTSAVSVSQAIASVTVSPASVAFASLGDTTTLTAVARDGNGNPIAGVTYTWATNNAAIAGVSQSGLVTAAGNGSATITASAGGQSGSSTITVSQVATSIAVTPPTATLTSLGDQQQFTASATDARGNAIVGKTFAWASSASGVATVSASGLVTAVANGSAQITASADGASSSAGVTVAQATASVSVTPASAAIGALGSTKQFTAQALDGRGNAIAGKSFAWSSDAPSVASIDASTGLATATGNGSATIGATVDGRTGTAVLTVQQVTASVAVSPAHDSLTALGMTRQFTAQPIDSTGHPIAGRAVSWSSGTPAVATIDAGGLATATGNGSATITATADGVNGTASLAVWQAIASVAISPASFSLTLATPTQALQASALDANGNAVTRAIAWTWSSSNEAAITVDTSVTAAANTATRVAPGTATITAAAEGRSGTADGTVAL